MFGLLRFRKSCKNDAWKQWRLHYCGTCKTMGRTYGQASRMLLNHDTVYLAEVLTALDPKPVEWGTPFRSFSCFALPEEQKSPAALRYAAAATVAMAEYKLRDQVEDSIQPFALRIWRMAKRWWSPRFRRAVRELESLGFDAGALDRALASQEQIESTASASLEDLAKPTATAVSLFFSHGASIVGRPELAAHLAEFGSTLGTLVYLLDAFEDQAKDAKRGEFNALSALSLTHADAIHELDRLAACAIEILRNIDQALSAAFASRLRANLDPRLGRAIPIVCCASDSTSRRPDWTTRWSAAWDRAEALAEGRKWPVLAAVAISVFAFPEHARSAESADECMSLGANLMALGSVFAVAIGRKKKIAAAAGAAAAGDAATSGGGGWGCGNCCSSSACDGCDCCCDCGDCCSSCGDCDCGGCDC